MKTFGFHLTRISFKAIAIFPRKYSIYVALRIRPVAPVQRTDKWNIRIQTRSIVC